MFPPIHSLYPQPRMPNKPGRFGRIGAVLAMLVCGFLGFGGSRLAAAEIGETQVGFAGLYHVGAWTPIIVQVNDPGTESLQLEVEAPDPDDNVVTYRGQPVQGTQRLELIYKTGRMQYDLVVRLKDASGNKVAEKKFRAGPGGAIPSPLPYSTRIWIGIGNPAGFEEPITEEIGTHLVARGAINRIADLPTQRSAYECIDAVIFAANGSDTDKRGIIDHLAKDSQQGEAFRQWISGGGLVLLSLGKDLERFSASSLGQWFPVLPTGQQTIRSYAPLQAYAGKPVRFDGAVPMTVVDTEARRIVVRGAATPLVIEAPYQFGRVYFCALDLDQKPFREWEGLTKFYDQILNRGLNRPEEQGASTGSSRLSHGGISDLATQLTRGVSRIDGINRTSLSGNLLLLMIYLIVIGPLDYLIVCRWLKKPELTWVTLPVLIALAGAGGLMYARSSNGQTPRSHSVSVVDIDSTSNHVHARNWVSLYSTNTKRTSIEVTPKSLSETTAMTNRLGWWGLPEGTIGGLYRSPGMQLGKREYRIGPETDRFERTPTQIWSTRTLASDWAGEGKPLVNTKLESSGVGNLQGSVTWMGEDQLQDCMLVYGNRVYFPRGKRGKEDSAELAPNFVWEPGEASQSTQREFRGFLTKLQTRTIKRQGTTATTSDVKVLETVAATYDMGSRDLDDIMPILCFHEYAGGSNYTQLQNNVLDEMDWSHHLRMGEAVLFGRIDRAVVGVSLDGTETSGQSDHRNTTFIRCLLPVTKVEGRDLRDFVSPLEKLKK